LKISQELLVAEGDPVAVRLALRFAPSGVTGRLRGFVGYERPIEMPGLAVFRFEDGRVVEMWSTWDNLVRFRQGGVLRWIAIQGFAGGIVVTSLAVGFVYFTVVR
jgi:predicted ester cyclase